MTDAADPPMKEDPDSRGAWPHTVAWFSSIDQARHAVLALERSGIDSTFIQISRRPASEERVLVDRRSMAWMARLGVAGVLGGLLLGAMIGAGLAAVLSSGGAGVIAGVVSGAVFGAFAGGFCLLAIDLPVSDESYDAFGGEPDGSDWVSVSGPREVQVRAAAVLHGLNPDQMDEAA